MGQTTSAPRVTQQDKAILQVKLQKDKLLQYQRRINVLIKSERANIKKLLKTQAPSDKAMAKTILKKIKYQEILIEKTMNQILNLENMISNIEFKLIENEFLKGLSNGNEIMKKLNNELNLNKVEDIIDEFNENLQYQNEIDELLSTAVVNQDFNEELDSELHQLEIELAMPEAPKETLVAAPAAEASPETAPEPALHKEQAKIKSKVAKTPLLA